MAIINFFFLIIIVTVLISVFDTLLIIELKYCNVILI